MTTDRTALTPVALLGVGAAAPALRLAAAEVAGAWGGGGRGTVAVCDADEDTLTLAWRAAIDALEAAGVAAAEVSGLWWATARPPFAEGPSHAFLSTALGLAPGATALLCSGSPHAGHGSTRRRLGRPGRRPRPAWPWWWRPTPCCPGSGTAGEFSTGAGAAAFVLGSIDAAAGGNGSGPPARLVRRTTSVLAVVDRYRGDAEKATGDVYDPRLFREEVFLPLLTAVGQELVAAGDTGANGSAPAAPAGWAIADPGGNLAPAVAKRLGGSAALGSRPGRSGRHRRRRLSARDHPRLHDGRRCPA